MTAYRLASSSITEVRFGAVQLSRPVGQNSFHHRPEHGIIVATRNREAQTVEKILADLLEQVKELRTEVKGVKDEHGAILRALEHRTEVMGANLTRLQEDVNYIRGQVTHLEHLGSQMAEIKENLLDVEDALKFALLKVAQHDTRLRHAK